MSTEEEMEKLKQDLKDIRQDIMDVNIGARGIRATIRLKNGEEIMYSNKSFVVWLIKEFLTN